MGIQPPADVRPSIYVLKSMNSNRNLLTAGLPLDAHGDAHAAADAEGGEALLASRCCIS